MTKNKIPLDEDYYIFRDQHCWTLVYDHAGEINPDTGKPTRTIKRSYHGTIEQAGLRYLDNKLIPHPTLELMIKELRQTREALKTFTNLLKLK